MICKRYFMFLYGLFYFVLYDEAVPRPENFRCLNDETMMNEYSQREHIRDNYVLASCYNF